MAMVVLVCLVLLVVTTVIHYEVLRGLAVLLPGLGIKPRARADVSRNLDRSLLARRRANSEKRSFVRNLVCRHVPCGDFC